MISKLFRLYHCLREYAFDGMYKGWFVLPNSLTLLFIVLCLSQMIPTYSTDG
jgi:hypothetical protein